MASSVSVIASAAERHCRQSGARTLYSPRRHLHGGANVWAALFHDPGPKVGQIDLATPVHDVGGLWQFRLGRRRKKERERPEKSIGGACWECVLYAETDSRAAWAKRVYAPYKNGFGSSNLPRRYTVITGQLDD